MRWFRRGVLMMGAMILPALAEFVPPAEGPVPFRRDKLPVDADTMASLSKQVTVLARTSVNREKRPRAVAQLTALALALDPENREARQVIDAMKEGTPLKADSLADAEQAGNRAWQALAWLEMPEAGMDARALAACLSDILVIADPHHPKAREREPAGEQGAWKSWVADEIAFQPRDPETSPEMKKEEEIAKIDPEPESDLGPVISHKQLALNTLSSPLPIWYLDRENKQVKLDMVSVELRIQTPRVDGEGESDDPGEERTNEPKSGGLQVRVPGEGMTERLDEAMELVEAAMIGRHGPLPPGMVARLNFGRINYSMSRNGMALTGTTALLIDGAITGKVPTAIVLAVVGPDGKLELPPRFWQTLQAFSARSPGTRVILPDQAIDFLTSLVVMDDAAFFMTNEVILAGTVDELCDFASPTPAAEVADGLKRFEEVRKVGQGKTLGTFVAHPATQQRLRDLVGVMPEHASARMLALQGSGSRPRFLQRPILARVIRSALEPMDYLAVTHPENLNAGRIEAVHKESREKLDRLAGYIELRDRDLHKAATDVADSLRPIARILEKRNGEDSDEWIRKRNDACNSVRLEYLRVLKSLSDTAGDAEYYQLPVLPDRE